MTQLRLIMFLQATSFADLEFSFSNFKNTFSLNAIFGKDFRFVLILKRHKQRQTFRTILKFYLKTKASNDPDGVIDRETIWKMER